MALTNSSTILKPIYENIPDELKQLNHWVCWKAVERKGKITKVPYQPNGKFAKSDDKNTWSTFAAAKQAFETSPARFDGIGFMLGEGIIGIDIDGCIDEIGTISDYAKAILNSVDSYHEVSVSGTGLHILLKGDLPGGYMSKNTKMDIEVYGGMRYFTITGVTFSTPKSLKPDQTGLINVLNQYFKKVDAEKENKSPQRKNKAAADMSNSDLWVKMFKSKNGQVLQALYNGDLSYHNGDHSGADQALCNALAFWTNKDPFRMDSMFRETALIRPKWDEMRGIATYGALTIEKAIRDTQATISDYRKPSPVQDFETNDLLSKLEYSKNGDKVLCNSRNLELILNSSPFKGILSFDAFGNTECIRGDLPWRKREFPNKPYEPWLPSDDKRLQHYLGKVYDFKSVNIIQNAYIEATRKNPFHPVKEYLESQTWDNVNRIDTFFIDYLGANDTPYVRAVTRKWLIAAVARIYDPGCQFDYMPVLVGPQGCGKSSTIAKLGQEWFSDSLKTFENKEAGEHLQSSWIFELGELAALKKSDVEEIKNFITKRSDSYRVAYDRMNTKFPRKCVFIGTTNTKEFLRDLTGNRRFWPITVDPKKRKYNPFEDLTDQVVGQIWAEALRCFILGEKLCLDPALNEEARKIQDEHLELDDRAYMIEEYLETLLPENWDELTIWQRTEYLKNPTGTIRRARVCTAEIWAECIGRTDYKDIKAWESRQICDIIRKFGWKERNPKQSRFPIYGPQKTFIRE